MTEGDTLVKALADVRQRKGELQAEFDRISNELAKLKLAEKALAAIVEGTPLAAADLPITLGHGGTDDRLGQNARGTGRGSRGPRGPRANSAKGRLKALLQETGPQGLTQAEISGRLPDVAAGTLNSYLSVMVTSGEAVRRGDFYTAVAPSGGDEPADDAAGTDADAGDATDEDGAAE